MVVLDRDSPLGDLLSRFEREPSHRFFRHGGWRERVAGIEDRGRRNDPRVSKELALEVCGDGAGAAKQRWEGWVGLEGKNPVGATFEQGRV